VNGALDFEAHKKHIHPS